MHLLPCVDVRLSAPSLLYLILLVRLYSRIIPGIAPASAGFVRPFYFTSCVESELYQVLPPQVGIDLMSWFRLTFVLQRRELMFKGRAGQVLETEKRPVTAPKVSRERRSGVPVTAVPTYPNRRCQ